MTQSSIPPRSAQSLSIDAAAALALGALGWILADSARADRLLALTGLTPAMLRDGLDRPATLAAVLNFLLSHEKELVSCAAALDSDPAALAIAAALLDPPVQD